TAVATLCDRDEIFATSDMVMKVKEPLIQEWLLLRPRQLLFAYLHLAAAPELTQALMEKQVSAVAFETIQLPSGVLPLLVPMSEIAGRMAIHVGAKYLEKESGGRGGLLSGVPGVAPRRVVILGAGSSVCRADRIALGMGADVSLIDVSFERLRYLDDIFAGRVKTFMSHPEHVHERVTRADLVIGATLIPGARTPHLISRALVRQMLPGAVLV